MKKKKILFKGAKLALACAVPVLAPAIIASEMLELAAKATLGEDGDKTPAGRAIKTVRHGFSGGTSLIEDALDD